MRVETKKIGQTPGRIAVSELIRTRTTQDRVERKLGEKQRPAWREIEEVFKKILSLNLRHKDYRKYTKTQLWGSLSLLKKSLIIFEDAYCETFNSHYFYRA